MRQLIVGWLLLLVALIPMNAQNGNVLGQVIRLPKSKGNIYQLLGLVTERSGYLFIYDSKIIDNEKTTSKLLNDLMEKNNVTAMQATPSVMQIFANDVKNMPYLKNLKYLTLTGEQVPISLVRKLKEYGDMLHETDK